MKTVPSIFVIILVLMGMSSCSDKNSLQNYILDNAEKVGFSSSTIPKSIFKPENIELTGAQLEAFEAIDRINVLVYQMGENNNDDFSTEKQKVKTILQQKKYEELINLGSQGIIKYTGKEDAIDEIVVFLSNKDMGFAIARIIGDDMNMNKFMELYKMTMQRDASDIKLNLDGLTDFITIK